MTKQYYQIPSQKNTTLILDPESTYHLHVTSNEFNTDAYDKATNVLALSVKYREDFGYNGDFYLRFGWVMAFYT